MSTAPASTSYWNPENVRDVAESVGLAALPDHVVNELAADVDYRLASVLEEALKFMRHAKRTTMTTQDISNALRVLNVEPLFGYESTRPLRFGEASLGPGQPLYYVEDEEVDFEKLINAPLPKVPREMTFTGGHFSLRAKQRRVEDVFADLSQRIGWPSRAYNLQSLKIRLPATTPTCCRKARTPTHTSPRRTAWTMSTSSRS